ncbi:MAG: DUF4358 domain-containing protein [bacterium]|nr:DUF4358 domain-containing protein [bacterium]
MKKMLVMLSVGVFLLGIAGCGTKADGDGGQQGNSQESGSLPESSGQQESSQPEGGSVGSAEGDQSSGENGGETSGTVVNGYDYADGWTEEMQGIRDVIAQELGENYWPDMALMPDELEVFVGVTPDLYEDYLAEMCRISNNVDTLIVVKAKEDRIEEVEEALNAYRDTRVNDTMQYPMNVGKIQASRVERHGRYIYFVQLGADTMDALDEGDEAVIVQCQEVNELVIELLNRNTIEE